jgi:hypothetical protein
MAEVDADPDNHRTVDPMDEVIRKRRAQAEDAPKS